MSYFTNLIFKHGIVAMFFIILIEYACFPISSEIVLPFSGAIASLQHINYFVILPVSVVAGLLGTTFCYIVGRIGGGALINKLVKKFPKAGNGLQSSQEKFIKYGGFAVCIGRLIPLYCIYSRCRKTKSSYFSYLFFPRYYSMECYPYRIRIYAT